MDKGFENSEKPSASSIYRGGMMLRVVLVIVFLCILGVIGFLSAKLFAKGWGHIFWFWRL